MSFHTSAMNTSCSSGVSTLVKELTASPAFITAHWLRMRKGQRRRMRKHWLESTSRPLLISVSVIMLAMTQSVWGRDPDQRYKDSPLHDWFEHLASRMGLCCSFADGYVVQDADWESKNGHYRVRVPKAEDSDAVIWVDVPDDAVITEPNRAGRTMVWPFYSHPGVWIRCFMPGSLI